LKAVQFIPGVLWFIITVILLTLPGNNFPEETILRIPHQDKIIHVVFFSLLVYLFSHPLKKTAWSTTEKKRWFIKIAMYAFVYGIAIEFIQEYFVPNRSFDAWDIVADAVGCLAGSLYCFRFLLQPKTSEKK
jgi:VanZ family protein